MIGWQSLNRVVVCDDTRRLFGLWDGDKGVKDMMVDPMWAHVPDTRSWHSRGV